MTEVLAVLVVLALAVVLVSHVRKSIRRKRGEGGSGGPHDGRPRAPY